MCFNIFVLKAFGLKELALIHLNINTSFRTLTLWTETFALWCWNTICVPTWQTLNSTDFFHQSVYQTLLVFSHFCKIRKVWVTCTDVHGSDPKTSCYDYTIRVIPLIHQDVQVRSLLKPGFRDGLCHVISQGVRVKLSCSVFQKMTEARNCKMCTKNVGPVGRICVETV